MTEHIAAGLLSARHHIAAACERVGRSPDDVTLVAISKGHGAAAIRAAFAAGQRHFGENYAAEWAAKKLELADLPIVWHFVGRVQRGNARGIAQAQLVHGVGSMSQAEALHKEAGKSLTHVPVLLQVNLNDEDTKNGFSSTSLTAALPRLRGLTGLSLQGLMAMPNVVDVRRAFASVRELRDGTCPDLAHLSMGMSGDFVTAVEEGATFVRLGTSIFGPRAALPAPVEQG